MSTDSVFSTGVAVYWHLDGVKFKTIPGLSPWTPLGRGGGGGRGLTRPLRGLEGNENSIFTKETALQYFPGKNPDIYAYEYKYVCIKMYI